MPQVAVADENLELEDDDLIEDIEEEEEEEETTPTITKKKAKRPRMILADENEYVFKSIEDAQTAIKEEKLLYTDGSKVEGFRIWEILKDVELNDKGRRTPNTGTLQVAVLARSKADAACFYAESRGFYIDMAFKQKVGGGRGRTLIPTTILTFGQMLAAYIFEKTYPHPVSGIPVGDPSSAMKGDAHPQYVKQWNENFGPGSNHAHFTDAEGNWKEATDKDD